MKNSSVILLLLSFLLFSCESDPDIMNDDAPKTLFVWGFADYKSGKIQVRIRRAIQEEGRMSVLAKNSDLLLPDFPIKVEVQINNYASLEMHPAVYPKQEGPFSTEKNIVYELEHPLKPGTSCTLKITNLESGKTISSSIAYPQVPPFKYPVSYGWFEPKYNFTNPEKPFHVDFERSKSLVQKLVTEIKYVDLLTNGDTICRKAIFEGQPMYYDIQDNGSDEATYSREFNLEYLFNIMNRTIPDDPMVKFRWFYRFNFVEWVADNTLRNYLQLAEKHKDNRKFFVNNINGGKGIFYSCNSIETGNILPTSGFFEALVNEPEIKKLKFTKFAFAGKYIDPDSTNTTSIFKSSDHE